MKNTLGSPPPLSYMHNFTLNKKASPPKSHSFSLSCSTEARKNPSSTSIKVSSITSTPTIDSPLDLACSNPWWLQPMITDAAHEVGPFYLLNENLTRFCMCDLKRHTFSQINCRRWITANVSSQESWWKKWQFKRNGSNIMLLSKLEILLFASIKE